jgi:hypothetical protein
MVASGRPAPSRLGRQYVYGIVRTADRSAGTGLAGVEDAPVRPVEAGPICALTSATGADRVRPSRANVHAHHAVVGEWHRSAPILPVRFGTVMPDLESVSEELLQPNAHRFQEMLDYVAGKDEFRLRATYLPDVAWLEILQRRPDIRRMRDRVAAHGGRSTQPELVEMGERVAAELEWIRETDAAELIGAIRGHAAATERLPDRSETVAVHAALLVARSRRARLENDVDRLGEKQSSRLRIELIGPLAPWDFVVEGIA